MSIATIAAMASVPATSVAAEPGLIITATAVQVNEAGAVTVHGTNACASGVAAYYGPTLPANLTVLVNIGWTASQRSTVATGPVGRAAPCFNNNPTFPLPQSCGTAANPCPWYSWMFDGSGNNESFFGSGFKPGPVHVDLEAGSETEPTGIIVIDGNPQFDTDGNLLTIGLIASGSANLRAERCNTTTGRPTVCDRAVTAG